MNFIERHIWKRKHPKEYEKELSEKYPPNEYGLSPKKYKILEREEKIDKILIYLFVISGAFIGAFFYYPDLVIDWFVTFDSYLILVVLSLFFLITGFIYYSKIGWKKNFIDVLGFPIVIGAPLGLAIWIILSIWNYFNS